MHEFLPEIPFLHVWLQYTNILRHRLLINDDINKKDFGMVFLLLESQLKIRCNVSIRYRIRKLSNPYNPLKQLFLSAIELGSFTKEWFIHLNKKTGKFQGCNTYLESRSDNLKNRE